MSPAASRFISSVPKESNQLHKCVRLKLNLRYIDPSVELMLTDGSTSFVIDSLLGDIGVLVSLWVQEQNRSRQVMHGRFGDARPLLRC